MNEWMKKNSYPPMSDEIRHPSFSVTKIVNSIFDLVKIRPDNLDEFVRSVVIR